MPPLKGGQIADWTSQGEDQRRCILRIRINPSAIFLREEFSTWLELDVGLWLMVVLGLGFPSR